MLKNIMILDETVKVKVSYSNKKHYSNFFENLKANDIIDVSVDNLIKSSTTIINVKCDYCGKTRTIRYDSYRQQTKNLNKYSCDNKKCIKEKIKQTNLLKYGVENPFQSKDIKEKIKQTNLLKYGVDNYSKTKECIDKIKQTKFLNFGFEKYRNENKMIETNLIKYGVENPFQNEDIKEKIKQTNLIKYGVENPFQNEEVKEKIKRINLIKYGKEHYTQTEEFWNKFKKSLKWKNYNGILYQTKYELDFIKYCENKKVELCNYVPNFEYILEDKKHTYFPDYYLEKYNLIVEIKSYYWLKAWEKKNTNKKNSVINSGYNYLMILDKNYDEFNKLLE